MSSYRLNWSSTSVVVSQAGPVTVKAVLGEVPAACPQWTLALEALLVPAQGVARIGVLPTVLPLGRREEHRQQLADEVERRSGTDLLHAVRPASSWHDHRGAHPRRPGRQGGPDRGAAEGPGRRDQLRLRRGQAAPGLGKRAAAHVRAGPGGDPARSFNA